MIFCKMYNKKSSRLINIKIIFTLYTEVNFMYVIMRNRGVIYYISDNWFYVFGFVIGGSIVIGTKLYRRNRRNKSKIKLNSTSSTDSIANVSVPRGGDLTELTLDDLYGQCFKDEGLYAIEDDKLARIIRNLILINEPEAPVFVSIGLYLYSYALANSKKMIINIGNNQAVLDSAKTALIKTVIGGIPAAILGGAAGLPAVGFGVLALLALLSAKFQLPCSEAVTKVSDIQHLNNQELHYVNYPEPRENIVYVLHSNTEHKQTLPLPICRKTTDVKNKLSLYERYLEGKTQCKPSYVKLKDRTRYLSDVTKELDPVIQVEVEDVISRIDGNNRKYLKEIEKAK